MAINCIVIDDEPLARELLEAHISKFPQLQLVASCENAIQAQAVLQDHQVDLVFLDIEMPLLKGNHFLKGLSHAPAVIITTAYREYAIEGYELNVVDYLLKPITFDRFFSAIEKFNSLHPNKLPPSGNQRTDEHLFVQSGNRHIKLQLQDILYIESDKDYITIHQANSADLHVKYNISVFQKLLDDRFLRIHRSYIINKNRLSSFARFSAWINETELPVGDSYKDDWKAFTDELLMKEQR